jgi:MFS family permease
MAGTICGDAAKLRRVRYSNRSILHHRIRLFDAFMNPAIPDRSVPPAPTPNLETFLLARGLQGFGIAATNLLAKAIITDSFSGQTLLHAFTYMAIAWGLAPIVAPMIGAHLQTWFGWQSCLVFLLIYSLVMWAALWRYRETLLRPVYLEPRATHTSGC